MADYNSSHGAVDYGHESQDSGEEVTPSKGMTTFTNVAGAVVSFALVIGIGVWGYKLLMRDVTGIPVVKAAVGEMRVRPEEPGGELAEHQGLSVNVIAAEGTAGAPADELRLAPGPIQLREEDRFIPAAMVATVPQDAPVTDPEEVETADAETPEVETPDVAAALQSGEVEDLVAQLTQGIAPLGDVVSDEVVVDEEAEIEAALASVIASQEAENEPAGIDAPGVRQSLRPQKRPAKRAQVVNASLATPAPAANASAQDIDAENVPAGTRLAQLGAFDSREVAYEQWDQLNTRFGAYLQDKKRVVQKAKSGGRTFYRLRAMGFEDIADARRFCSALVAENADCIPVVTR